MKTRIGVSSPSLISDDIASSLYLAKGLLEESNMHGTERNLLAVDEKKIKSLTKVKNLI